MIGRLHAHLASVPARYSHAWKQVDEFRAARGKALPDWPSWCFLPMAGAYAIATGGRNDVLPQHSEVAVIAALGAWRVAKDIYRFDRTVFEELWQTPVEGDLPAEVLERLPAWCCYVPFPEPRYLSFSATPNEFYAHGFFVHLEHDVNSGRRELRFLIDYAPFENDANVAGGLTGFPVHIRGNLPECVDATIDEMERQFHLHGAKQDGVPEALASMRAHMAASLAPLISLTLYLCSTSAEIVPRGGYRPKLRHARRESQLFAAQEPVVWEVAYRIGATLRAAQNRIPSRDRGGSHASPRPHIRRAHWHSFWTGERAKAVGQQTKRELVLRWLPPTGVKCGLENEAVPTIHQVTR